ncbi:MAG: flagellar biosynthesis protein FlgL [Paracoccaceae bacterium]|nr:MAG: flagellar biosynthesis protein FlgL [Paracoccaceae bacterium]
MAIVSAGDMSLAFQQRRDAAALKLSVRRLATEVTTGRVADTARAVRGDLVPLAGLQTSIARAGAYRTASAEAALFVGGMQAVLGRIDDLATAMSGSLLTAGNTGQPAMVAAVAQDAAARFDAAVSALNTRLGDRTLFAGTGTGGPALTGGTALLDALAAAAGGAVTAAETEAAVRAWFTSPAGFGAAYQGGAPPSPLPLSPEDTLRIDLTAQDPALRDTLAGLAMAALIDRGVPAGGPAERADLARRAGEALISGATGRAGIAARLGVAEARIEAADRRNATEITALEIARAQILEADSYAAATALEAAQSQLETLHAVTARLSRLSLVDFLR